MIYEKFLLSIVKTYNKFCDLPGFRILTVQREIILISSY